MPEWDRRVYLEVRSVVGYNWPDSAWSVVHDALSSNQHGVSTVVHDAHARSMYHATYDSGTETPLAPDTTARSPIYIVVCVSSMTLRPAIWRIV